jgi:putative ABC transport system permease protein
MSSLVRGFRSGLSLFRTNPGSAVAAVLALALGIGFSTTMFSIVHGGTRGLPFDDPESIVAVQPLLNGPGVVPSSTIRDFSRWAQNARSFEGLGAFQTASRNLSGAGESPERISTAVLTPGVFELLHISPLSGRGLVAADAAAGTESVAILSHALWTRRYAGDPAVLGRTIRLDGVPHIVVGVMPSGFGFPINASLWTALRTGDPSAAANNVQVFGRLAAGTQRSVAEAELLAIARGAAETEQARASIALALVDFIELETPRETRWGLYLLLLAVSGVLIIACVNVANLFIVRAIARSRDVAVRLALGAGRKTIVVEQMAESLVLSSIAAVAGLGIAWAGTRAFRLGTADILQAFWMDFRLDAVVVVYASGVAVAAACAAAIFPALRASRTDIVSTLRDGGTSGSGSRIGRLSRGLLAGQIAMACGLLAFTLLLGQAAVEIHTRAWPFDPDHLLAAEIGIPAGTFDDADARERLLVRLEEELSVLPGARSAALASALPGRGSGNWTFTLDAPAAQPSTMMTTGVTMVSHSYFETLGGRLLRGRGFTSEDRAAAPVSAVVNESFAARHSPGRDPIGRRVFLGKRELTIVGVVSDLMPRDVDEPVQDGLYVSIHQMRPNTIRVLVAGSGDPMSLTRGLRQGIDRVDPDWPLQEVSTVREGALREKQVLSVLSRLFSVFGAGALFLTAVGLYSVTAFSVALRRREFGIRVALGATRRDLLGMLAGQGGRQLIVGLTVGTLMALGLTRGFRSALDFTTGNDAVVLGAVIVMLCLTSAAAIAAPAFRASRTDPVTALRD